MKNVRNSSKTCTPSKKVKRLQSGSNSLWEKLEPTMPLDKPTKFKSPYKSSLIQLNPKSHSDSDNTGLVSNVDRTSTVKIQPIDPFKFCEAMSEKSKKDGSKNVPGFEKSLKAKNKVNGEVIALIQKTAATIKLIRKQNEDWMEKRQSMSFLQSIEEQHIIHRKKAV